MNLLMSLSILMTPLHLRAELSTAGVKPVDAYVQWRRTSFDYFMESILPPGEVAVEMRERARDLLTRKVESLAATHWYAENHGRGGGRDAAFNARIDELADRVFDALRDLIQSREGRSAALERALEALIDSEALITAYTPGRIRVMIGGAIPPFLLTSTAAMFLFFATTSTQSAEIKAMFFQNIPWLMGGMFTVGAAVPTALASFGLGRRLLLKFGSFNGLRGGGMVALESRLWARVRQRVEADPELRATFGTAGNFTEHLKTRILYLTDVPTACSAWLGEHDLASRPSVRAPDRGSVPTL